jgi:hypothetical protein
MTRLIAREEFSAVVPKVGCTAPWGAVGLCRGALEVCHSKGVGHLFTIEVTLDWTLGNWYQFIKSIKNLLRVK